MSEERENPQQPTMGAAAFACPHCKAHAQQQWWKVNASSCSPDRAFIPEDEQFKKVLLDMEEQEKPDMLRYKSAVQAADPQPYREKDGTYSDRAIPNMFLTTCFVCKKGSVWLAGGLIWPERTFEVSPGEDLPTDVLEDFVEASLIVQTSPRGAAALLRLAIEKLCVALEKKGTIDQMIQQLVDDGLPVRIQQALDVVRVIGNEAVHPGTIDLKDDHATVLVLFRLVNLITETMISEPRRISEIYSGLPPEKLAGIQQRQARADAAAGKDKAEAGNLIVESKPDCDSPPAIRQP
ncbi:DUF4145 domain-containing protein [Brevundimonas sp.]|uniref:DUF4145 domain-containing protein n=1 Tax=Brevundimonas sp. TaxID=1871086 RepID=UPI0028B207D3|nr:DUF4145 domain-containing protein [Brevundimonas sp.]